MAKWSLKDLFKKDEPVQEPVEQTASRAYVDERTFVDGSFIDRNSFTDEQRRNLTHVQASSVNEIGERSFDGAINLEKVHAAQCEDIGKLAFINSTVKNVVAAPGVNIGDGAFMGSEIESMSKVGNVGNYAFASSDIKDVHFHSTAKEIGNEAFRGCNNLTDVQINEGMKSIGDGAFKDCKNLEQVWIPATVESVGKDAFKGCDKVEILVSDMKLAQQICNEYPQNTVVWSAGPDAKFVMEPEKTVTLDNNVRNLSDYLNTPDYKNSVQLHTDENGITKVVGVPESLTKVNWDIPYAPEREALRESNLKEINCSYENPCAKELFDARAGLSVRDNLCFQEEFQAKVEEANKIKAMEKDIDKANEVEKEKPKDMEIDFG